MPENLTGWKVKVWAMGHGTKVGQGEAEVVTKKDLIVRLQAPRFFVQKDEVVLSANVHNYLKTEKKVDVTLELDGGTLAVLGNAAQHVTIAAGGEKRVDWRVKVQSEGDAVIRMKAITDEESDAMEMRFPCFVHGMLKTDSFSGVIRPDKDTGQHRLQRARRTPHQRNAAGSPLLADAGRRDGRCPAVPGRLPLRLHRADAQPLPAHRHHAAHPADDEPGPEGHREEAHQPQRPGDRRRQERAKGWKRFHRNPVFDEAEVQDMAKAGVQALAGMQLSDGGWGWFSGFGEHSSPHTTAVVVHGLQLAEQNDVAVPPGMLERGLDWLKNYQAEQVRRIQNAPGKTKPWKEHADNLDAFVYMVLVDADVANDDMRDFLYRDRTQLAVYAKAMFGLALHKQQKARSWR